MWLFFTTKGGNKWKVKGLKIIKVLKKALRMARDREVKGKREAGPPGEASEGREIHPSREKKTMNGKETVTWLSMVERLLGVSYWEQPWCSQPVGFSLTPAVELMALQLPALGQYMNRKRLPHRLLASDAATTGAEATTQTQLDMVPLRTRPAASHHHHAVLASRQVLHARPPLWSDGAHRWKRTALKRR